MATGPEQQKFDEAAAAVESAIEDPKLTAELIPKIAELKVSSIADKDNSKRAEELNDIVNKKLDLQREIDETEKKTSDSNQDWKKITEDIKSTDVTKRDAAIEAGKTLVAQSRARMNELSAGIVSIDATEPRLLATITVKAIAAHNKNIENVQALDPKNEITFVPKPRIGGEEAVKALTEIEQRGKEFISKDLNDALKAVKDAVGPSAQKNARDALKKVETARREEIYIKMNEVTGDPTPYVNAEKQVAALLGQLKEMNDEIKVVSPEAPATAPAATPTPNPSAPNATPTAPNTINVPATKLQGKVENNKITVTVDPKDAEVKVTRADGSVKVEKAVNGLIVIDNAPNGSYKFESGTSTFTAKVDVQGAPAAPSLSPEDTAKVDAVKDAVVKDDKAAIEKSLEDFNKLPSGPLKQIRVDAINKALTAAGHTKTHAALDTSDKIVIVDGSPATPNTVTAPPDKVQSQLEKLLAFFKELIDFLRGDSQKNGDLGALKAEVQSIDEQIAKLKKDNPDFSTKPAILKQITDLEVKRNELQLTIDRGIKIGSRVVDDANRFISGSPNPLFVRAGRDRNGNPFLRCTRNTPEARGHMSYMTGRLQKIHPGLGFNQQAAVDQRVYFHFHGDVHINSHNTTDNSRTVTNTVSGTNNTGSASADGTNLQEQTGGAGATLDGRAKNKVRLTPEVPTAQPIKPTINVPVEPMKPKLSVPVELPPVSGSL